MWDKPSIDVSSLQDTRAPNVQMNPMGLWDISNQLISSLREIGSNYAALPAVYPDLAANRDYYFLHTNAPWVFFSAYQSNMDGLVMRAMQQIDGVNNLKLALLVLEVRCLYLSRIQQFS
jgi:hypothetical protein